MSGACQISLVDKSAIVALWSSTDQRASKVWSRTENVHTEGVEKDRAILPKVSLRKLAKANEGSCWCARGSHQVFNVYFTRNSHHLLNKLTLSKRWQTFDLDSNREKSRSQSSTFWHIPEKHGFHFLMRKFRNSIDRMSPQMKLIG